jgi:SOS-response transcriptional repressor LexA
MDVLKFVHSTVETDKIPPTTREIQEHFGWGSQTSAVSHISALKAHGVVEVDPNKSRSIKVTSKGIGAITADQDLDFTKEEPTPIDLIERRGKHYARLNDIQDAIHTPRIVKIYKTLVYSASQDPEVSPDEAISRILNGVFTGILTASAQAKHDADMAKAEQERGSN